MPVWAQQYNLYQKEDAHVSGLNVSTSLHSSHCTVTISAIWNVLLALGGYYFRFAAAGNIQHSFRPHSVHTWQVFCSKVNGRKVVFRRQGLCSCPVCLMKGVPVRLLHLLPPVTFKPDGWFYTNQMEEQRFQKYSAPVSFVKSSARLKDRLLILWMEETCRWSQLWTQ